MKNASVVRWCLITLAFFPIVDFLVRKIPVVGSLMGAAWYLILIVLAALALGRYLSGDRLEPLPYHKLLKSFILLGVAYLAMGVTSFSVDFEGFRAIYTYSFYAFIIPFIVDKELSKRLVRYTLYAGFIIGLHGVYQFITQAPMLDPSWADAGESLRTRVYSVFRSPNIMGSYMIMMFPMAVGMAWSTRSKKERLFFAFVSLITLAALVFTFTRSAWLALFVAFAITAALFDRRLLILIVVVAVAAMFVPQIQSRIFQLFDPLYWYKASRDGRIFRWLTAYDAMRNNPFFGAGMGHIGGAVAARNFSVHYVDSYYFKTLAEMGLVGLLTMFTLFGAVLRDLFRRIFKPLRARPDWPLLLGMFTSVLAILVQNAVENVFEVPAMNFLFWFVVSMAVILTGSAGKEETKALRKSPSQLYTRSSL